MPKRQIWLHAWIFVLNAGMWTSKLWLGKKSNVLMKNLQFLIWSLIRESFTNCLASKPEPKLGSVCFFMCWMETFCLFKDNLTSLCNLNENTVYRLHLFKCKSFIQALQILLEFTPVCVNFHTRTQTNLNLHLISFKSYTHLLYIWNILEYSIHFKTDIFLSLLPA